MPTGADLAGLLEQGGLAPEHAAHNVGRFERTFETMRPFLPARCDHFLDIGCGLGGVAMHVARHYQGRAVAHLLDGAAPGAKWVSYRADGAPWADVATAARLFGRHRPGYPVRAWTPETILGCDARFELIYSNCSWGHHYPIAHYLDFVRRALRPGGTLIVDLRLGEVGAHGVTVLAAFFHYVADAHQGRKYRRTVWKA